MSAKSYYETPPPRYSEIDEKKPLIPKKPKETVKQVCGIRRSSFLLSLYLVFYGVFLATGSLIFTVLEAPEEENLRVSVFQAKIQFLNKHTCVKDEELENLMELIVSASNKGVSTARNDSVEPNWSFGQSIFFSSTVVTTIGYGHVTPLSKIGKCFCIIFGILGIPLTMMLLTALVDRLLIPSFLLLDYLNSKLDHLFRPFYIRLFHFWILLSLLFIFFWLIPAAVFAYLEPDWDLFDGIYYCFISLTTIGLGDYIPGDSPEQEYPVLYKILTTVYLYIGLAFLILTLTTFYAIPQLNFGIFFLMQTDEEDEEENEEPKMNKDSEKVKLQTTDSTALKQQQQQQQQPQQTNVTQDPQHTVVNITEKNDSPTSKETSPAQTIP